MPWETTTELVGSRPYTTGIGVLKANEKTKMEPVQCARKRAEADAIKRRFDVEFGAGIQEADEYPGDWVVEGESPSPERTGSGEEMDDPDAADKRETEHAADRDALFRREGRKRADTARA